MQNFLRIRVAIDSLIDGTKLSIQEKSVADSMGQIERARELVQKLQQVSTSDQDAIVAKRRSTIEALAVNVGKLKNVPRKKVSARKASAAVGNRLKGSPVRIASAGTIIA